MIRFNSYRSHERKPYFRPVELIAERCVYREYIHDISPSGVLVETDTKFPIGLAVVITFPLPNGRIFKIQGDVVRHATEGIGIRFSEEDRLGKRRLAVQLAPHPQL